MNFGTIRSSRILSESWSTNHPAFCTKCFREGNVRMCQSLRVGPTWREKCQSRLSVTPNNYYATAYPTLVHKTLRNAELSYCKALQKILWDSEMKKKKIAYDP
jgi:hypothetical protein